MSGLWTPDGEIPVDRSSSDPGGSSDEDIVDLSEDPDVDPELAAQLQAEMAQARERLLGTPAEVIVANHVMGLYELGALHLTSQPPDLPSASLAIDAVGLLVEELDDRLAHVDTLRDALAQLRLAYVEVHKAVSEGREPPTI